MAMPTQPEDARAPPVHGPLTMDAFNPYSSHATQVEGRDLLEELRQAKREIELLKSMVRVPLDTMPAY
jgi:hypothetical protein